MTVRTIALCAALAVSATACGSKSTTAPTGPTTSIVTFQATLLPANEVPAFNNAESASTGTVTITFHVTKDTTGAITAATADFQASVSGMPAGSTVTMAHIHPGVAGVSGGILVATGVASGDMPLTNGAGSFTKTAVPMTADQATQIIANPSAFYFNIHSVLNGGGFTRGQLTLKQ